MRASRLIFVILCFCLVLVGSVSAQTATPTPVSTSIVLATPTPSPASNITATPTPLSNVTIDNSTTIIYDSAVGVVSVNPNGQSLFFSTYNQTAITLTYANAVSYSSNVTSLDYNHFENSRPTSMSVTLTGVSTYVIHFQVLYDRVVNQSISLTIVGGDGNSQVLPLVSFNRGFTLDVTVSTKVLPHYPTAEEQAAANAAQNALLQQNDHNFITSQMGWITPAVIIISVIVIILVVVILIVLHWARQADKRQIARKYQGYGYNRLPKKE